MPIGMSVPGASSLFSGQSLADQVAGETEEQRKRRLMAMQQNRTLPASSDLGLGYSAALGQ